MHRFEGLGLVLLVVGLCVAPAGFGHPYEGSPENTPMAFILHVTEDGRPIYTNIPKKCFSGKRLTCIHLHPVFRGPGTVKAPEP